MTLTSGEEPRLLLRGSASIMDIGFDEEYGLQLKGTGFSPYIESKKQTRGFAGCGKTRPWHKTSRLCNRARL
jgi:hypothetical protein